jgi:hypothetical protein
MDAERQHEQPRETVTPRFVWDLELAHTNPVARPDKQSKAVAKPNKAVEPRRTAEPGKAVAVTSVTSESAQPVVAEQPRPAPRPRRRRVLLPVSVAVAVIAAGTFAVMQLDGHDAAAKTGGTQAAEVGSAEYPQAGIQSAGTSSTSSHNAITPSQHPSKAPAHHGASPNTNADAKKSLNPAGIVATQPPAASAPKTAATTSGSGSAGQPAAPPTTSTPAMPSVVEALSDQWSQCALLNGSCSVSLPSVVALGANGYFNYGTFDNTATCSFSVFGNPNASGQNACYSEPTPTASSVVWTECAAENGTCGYAGVMTIAFGANGDYNYATLGGGGTACTDSVFGDPDYNTAKACYMMAPPPQFTHWDLCATNGGTCTFSDTQEVAYGADGRYTYGIHTSSTPCTTSALGNPEASGTRYCYVQNYYMY